MDGQARARDNTVHCSSCHLLLELLHLHVEVHKTSQLHVNLRNQETHHKRGHKLKGKGGKYDGDL